MVIELKTEVSINIERVSRIKLLQAFLEGCYTMQDNQQRSVLVCVSDLETFHVIKLMKGSESPLLEVVQGSTCCKASVYTDVLQNSYLLCLMNCLHKVYTWTFEVFN